MNQSAKCIFQSIAICYQAAVAQITKFISVFAEYQQYVELSQHTSFVNNKYATGLLPTH
jgi:hypothetical protein